jgi:hypothetical protein
MAIHVKHLRSFFLVVVLAGMVPWIPIRASHPAEPKKSETPTLNPYDLPLPVYWILGRKDVREEIGLSPEQTQKLRDLSRKHLEGNKPLLDTGAWAKMSPEERRKKSEEIAAENKKRLDTLRKEIEGVLTPDQFLKLENVDLRLQASQLLLYTQVGEKLGLSEPQKDQLRKNREELAKKIAAVQYQLRQLQEQAGKAALEVLTPEQVDKLKKMRRETYGGWGPLPRPVPPKK